MRAAEKSIENIWSENFPLVSKYISFPLNMNPLNLIDWELRVTKELYKNWFQRFIDAEGGKMTNQQYRFDCNPMPQFNQRALIVSFQLTYDPLVKMMVT